MNALFNFIGNFFRMFVIFITIAPWEQAVRTRLGKYVTKYGPGPHLKLPWIDQVYVQTTRLRRGFIPTQTLSTKDGYTMVVGGSIAYQICDVLKLYQTLHHAEETLAQTATAAIADIVFTTNKADIDPMTVARLVTKQLQGRFKQYGLSDVSVNITDFAFVKTYRLVNEGRYSMAGPLSTSNPSQAGGMFAGGIAY